MWEQPRAFLEANFPDAPVRRLGGTLDCADPGYQKFLLEQADRDIRWILDSAGICIDGTLFMQENNPHADDGVSWVNGRVCTFPVHFME